MPVSPREQGGEPVDTEAALGVSCCGALRGKGRQNNVTAGLRTLLPQLEHPQGAGTQVTPSPPARGGVLGAQHGSQSPNVRSSQGVHALGSSTHGAALGWLAQEGRRTGHLSLLLHGEVSPLLPRTLEATTSARFPTGHTTATHSCSRSTGTSISHSDSISCGETRKSSW